MVGFRRLPEIRQVASWNPIAGIQDVNGLSPRRINKRTTFKFGVLYIWNYSFLVWS
jgi:hypothetical protein